MIHDFDKVFSVVDVIDFQEHLKYVNTIFRINYIINQRRVAKC